MSITTNTTAMPETLHCNAVSRFIHFQCTSQCAGGVMPSSQERKGLPAFSLMAWALALPLSEGAETACSRGFFFSFSFPFSS